MAELYVGGQAPPPALPGFDFDELIARIEAKFQPKQEILPNAVYDRDEAIAITGFSLSTFIRAEQKRKLKGRWEGRRRYYLGVDLLDWLKGKEGNHAIN
jgi:hypothetical protein